MNAVPPATFRTYRCEICGLWHDVRFTYFFIRDDHLVEPHRPGETGLQFLLRKRPIPTRSVHHQVCGRCRDIGHSQHLNPDTLFRYPPEIREPEVAVTTDN